MYQPKVNNTQKYEDSQGSHVVTTSKLILIYLDKSSAHWVQASEEVAVLINGSYYKPIIVSETEEIEEDDYVYILSTSDIQEDILKVKSVETGRIIGDNDFWYNIEDCAKILALPKHFSDKHLQAIVDGKMEDGDEVLVKCVGYSLSKDSPEGLEIFDGDLISLDQENHITLFPAEQRCPECGCTNINQRYNQRYDGTTAKWEECDQCGEIIDDSAKQSLEEAAKQYYYAVQPKTDEEFIQMFKDAAEWAKKNNY